MTPDQAPHHHKHKPRFDRRRLMTGGIVIAIFSGLVGAGIYFTRGSQEAPRQFPEIHTVHLLTPPPPPPPPPQEQPPPQPQQQASAAPEPKMVEQEPVKNDVKPGPKDDSPDNSKSNEPPGIEGLDATPGAGGLLAGKGNGGGGRGGGGGGRWGWYAGIVQTQIEAALRANPKTRNAVLQVRFRLWADSSGRITRVQIVSSSGDPALDAVLRDEVLTGLVLREPPPKDMPMPIVTRVTERKLS